MNPKAPSSEQRKAQQTDFRWIPSFSDPLDKHSIHFAVCRKKKKKKKDSHGNCFEKQDEIRYN